MTAPAAPVVLGSSLSGLLVSLSLSRAGIEHVLIGGGEPAAIPRLGEALTDGASPELWRLFGREFPECFFHKSHISILDGHFATLIHLADPLRGKKRVAKFAPAQGKPRYPWFGEALFHLDRIAFDRAVYRKALAEPCCRFVTTRVSHLEFDAASDAVIRIDFSDGPPIERPRYVFDATGGMSLVARAARLAETPLGPAQRVVFTHFRRADAEPRPPEWWRHGTNLLRLDRDFDGLDAMAWLIPIGRTLSVGMSLDAEGEHGADDRGDLMARLDEAFRRRGLDYRPLYPDQQPIQDLRHRYSVRQRASGRNWLLVGGSFITIWFPSSTGLWTATAAAALAPRLLDRPDLGVWYEKTMRGLIPLHHVWDGLVRGPSFRSSLQVYRFLARGMHFIPRRIASYLRILDDAHGWFRPLGWLLTLVALVGSVVPPVMLFLGGFAVVRTRLAPDRMRQAAAFPLYFHSIVFRVWSLLRAVPHLLWAAIPRRGPLAGKPGLLRPPISETGPARSAAPPAS
ncbi:MAG: hypothetical protein EXR72_10920 [Myxococcales bacterium]|nr:hypothetical protein [Myxococcales bacterium]